MGLARGHVHLYEGDVGQAQYGAIFMFFCTYLFVFCCLNGLTKSYIIFPDSVASWISPVRQAWSWVLPSVGIGKVEFKSLLSPY